jgi:phospholipid/cholesterol/gamma-HCH transport system substrate-binding protein
MRSTRTIDISTGLFVMLGFAAILFMVTQITNREFSLRSDSYRLKASFENIGGLKPGAPVSMAGVAIGRVEDIQYDMNLLKAVVTLRIDGKYAAIPNDSDASIFTAGLLGGQYIGLTPGGSDEAFQNGETIELVQDAVVLENLISKYLFNSAATRTDEAAAAPSAAAQE